MAICGDPEIAVQVEGQVVRAGDGADPVLREAGIVGARVGRIAAQQEYAEYRRTAGSYNRYTNRAGGSRYYRVYRNGSYYQTDNRGAELLRQAVNSGYQQGYRQGQLDARYNRGSNYYGNNMYRTGTYGYQSYVARDQYQYYFQQGFQRGYEDGFNNQYRYGYRTNSGLNILGNILNGILNMSQN